MLNHGDLEKMKKVAGLGNLDLIKGYESNSSKIDLNELDTWQILALHGV